MTPGGEGWWIASDGRWYPPEKHPYLQAPAPPSDGLGRQQPLGAGIGTAATVLLLVTAGLNVLISILGFYLSSAAGRYVQSGSLSDLDDWVSAEDTYFGAVGLGLLAWITTFILLIIWLAKAHSASSSLLQIPTDRKYSRGWSIGVWFVPFANLISTPMVFAEVQRIAYADRVNGRAVPDWRSGRLDPKLVWWWTLFIGGVLVSRAAENMFTIDGPLDEYQAALNVSAVGTLVAAAGAATGAMFIRSVSSRLNENEQAATPVTPAATRPVPTAAGEAGWAPPTADDGLDRPATTQPVLDTTNTSVGSHDRSRPSLPLRPRDQSNPTKGEFR